MSTATWANRLLRPAGYVGRCAEFPCHLPPEHRLPHNAQAASGGLIVWPDIDPMRCREGRGHGRYERYRCKRRLMHPPPHRANGCSWWPMTDEEIVEQEDA